MARLIKYDNGLLFNGAELVFTASDVGNPDPECCCDTGCPPGGLCPCPDASAVLFLTNWPGELSPGQPTIDCEDECPYLASSNGSFTCSDGINTCAWTVTICAEITCNSIDGESGCGSDCTLANIVVTVDTSSCACPDELPDYSGFDYFWCP